MQKHTKRKPMVYIIRNRMIWILDNDHTFREYLIPETNNSNKIITNQQNDTHSRAKGCDRKREMCGGAGSNNSKNSTSATLMPFMIIWLNKQKNKKITKERNKLWA